MPERKVRKENLFKKHSIKVCVVGKCKSVSVSKIADATRQGV